MQQDHCNYYSCTMIHDQAITVSPDDLLMILVAAIIAATKNGAPIMLVLSPAPRENTRGSVKNGAKEIMLSEALWPRWGHGSSGLVVEWWCEGQEKSHFTTEQTTTIRKCTSCSSKNVIPIQTVRSTRSTDDYQPLSINTIIPGTS